MEFAVRLFIVRYPKRIIFCEMWIRTSLPIVLNQNAIFGILHSLRMNHEAHIRGRLRQAHPGEPLGSSVAIDIDDSL